MKQETLIKNAWRAYARAYEYYHETCHQTAMKVYPIRVTFIATNKWEINGVIRNEPAAQIIFGFMDAANECYINALQNCKPLGRGPADFVPSMESREELEAVE